MLGSYQRQALFEDHKYSLRIAEVNTLLNPSLLSYSILHITPSPLYSSRQSSMSS